MFASCHGWAERVAGEGGEMSRGQSWWRWWSQKEGSGCPGSRWGQSLGVREGRLDAVLGDVGDPGGRGILEP